MAEYKLYKVNTLPVTLEPNSLYFVKEGDRFRQVLTDIAGVAVEGRQLSWSEILSIPTTLTGFGLLVEADGRYLQSYTETDPVFIASAASNITATNITNWNTSFGWGNHTGLYDNYQSWNLKSNGVQRTTVGSGGTLDLVAGANTTIGYSAGGVMTISSTDTIYTHPTSHPISFITGLQTALDGKVDDSQVLTNVPAGALFTDTIYTHPTNPNFNTDLNGATVFQNITINNGHITGMTTRSLTAANIGAEPSFTKNSAFNKNFGSNGVATTVSRSDHNHFRNVTPLGGDNFTTTLNRNSTNLVTWYNTTGVGRSLTIGTGWLKNDEIEGSYTGASTLPINGGSGVTILVPDGLTAVIPTNGVYGIKFISDNVGVLFGTLIPV